MIMLSNDHYIQLIISIEGSGKSNDNPLDGLDFSLAKIKLLKCQGKAKK